MKIIIFGCRKITVDVISYILQNGHEIPLVATYDEERDRIYGSPLVAEYCKLNNISNIRFDSKVDVDLIRSYNPELIFSTYYRKILKQDILDIPKFGCINIHPAILPKGRGPAPTMWNVLHGDEFAGATMHYMTEDVDAGDIIDQKILRINGRTGFELNRDLMNICYDLFEKNFDSICNGSNKRIAQIHSDAEYCLPFKKSLRYMTWGDPDEIVNKIRAFAKPYDGVLSYTARDEKIVVWDGIKLPKRESLKPPGCFEKTNDGIVVQTNTVPILITEYNVLSDTFRDSGRFISGPPAIT